MIRGGHVAVRTARHWPAAVCLLGPLLAAAAGGAQSAAGAAPLTLDIAADPNTGLGEPEIAVDPHNPSVLVIGENNTGLSVSSDRGRSWRKVSVQNPGDNVLAVEPDGTFIASSLDGDVQASSDGGISWSSVGNWVGVVAAQVSTVNSVAGRESGCSAPFPLGPVQPLAGPGPHVIGCDRPWATADARTGALYISFTDHNDPAGGVTAAGWETRLAACAPTVDTSVAFACGRQYVAASHDRGRTWSAFRPFDSADYPAGSTGGFSGQPVAAEGVLATAYLAGGAAGQTCAPCVVFETSSDDGITWTRHVVPGATPSIRSGVGPVIADPLGGPSVVGVTAGTGLLLSDDPTVLFEPYVAADPSHRGRYALMILDATRTHLLVYVTADSGRSWSPPATLAEDGGHGRWNPWIAYGPSGALGAMWRTRYADGTYAIWAAVSPGGDARFARAVRLSSALSPGPVYQGAGDDASYVTLDAVSLHAVWGDRRGGGLGIWYGRYDFAADAQVQQLAAGSPTGPASLPLTAAGRAGAAGLAAVLLVAVRLRARPPGRLRCAGRRSRHNRRS